MFLVWSGLASLCGAETSVYALQHVRQASKGQACGDSLGNSNNERRSLIDKADVVFHSNGHFLRKGGEEWTT